MDQKFAKAPTPYNSYSLNRLSKHENAKILIRDFLAYEQVVTSEYSMGSFRLEYIITSVSQSNISVTFKASDTLRLGSLTRIPKINKSLLPDNPFGTYNVPFNNIKLEWNWTEEIPRK